MTCKYSKLLYLISVLMNTPVFCCLGVLLRCGNAPLQLEFVSVCEGSRFFFLRFGAPACKKLLVLKLKFS